MFVAIKYGSEPESDDLKGPFTSEESGTKWVRSYLTNVVGWNGLNPAEATIADADWVVKEVEFVDEDEPLENLLAEGDLEPRELDTVDWQPEPEHDETPADLHDELALEADQHESDVYDNI